MMKKIFLITALFFVTNLSFCQITCPLGYFVPLANVNLTNLDYSFRDVGTNIYINEYFYGSTAYRITAVFRKNGYWYIVDDFYTGSYTNPTPNIGTSIIRARSAYKNLTINPPCSSKWFTYATSPLAVSWLPPFSTLPELNSSYNNVDFIITGTTCSSNLYDFAGINTTPSLHPNYIDLPKKDEVQLNLEIPAIGKLNFNLPNQTLVVGNGVSWEKVLFDKKDINMPSTSKINFGDETTSIFAGNDAKEIRVKSDKFLFSDTFTGISNNNDHNIMALNQGNPVIYGGVGAPIEFYKSHATPLTTFSGSFTVNDKNNVLVYIGTSSTAIITLPDAGFAIRRHYTLTNHGNNVSISISPALKNGFSSVISSLPAGQSFFIVSDGTNWRLISRSTL